MSNTADAIVGLARSARRPAPRTAGVLLVLALGLATLTSGCSKPEPAHVPISPPADEVFATPVAVTRAALECIHDKLVAVDAGDKTEARRCDERLLMLAAKDDIRRRMAANPIFKIIVGDQPVEGYVELWGPTIAFYAGGFDVDHMTTTALPADAARAVVRVPATGRDGQTVTLLVTCARDAQGHWGVSRIDFAPTGSPATTRPTSQPTPPA